MSAVETNIIPLSGRAEPRRTLRSLRAVGTNSPLHQANATPPAPNVHQRGYFMLYRHGVTNYCLGCGKTHGYVGNRTAQCAFCDTALDLQRLA